MIMYFSHMVGDIHRLKNSAAAPEEIHEEAVQLAKCVNLVVTSTGALICFVPY